MAYNKTAYTFNKLINVQSTDNTLNNYYNEVGDLTINTHAKELWLDPVPADPSVGSDPYAGNIQAYTQLALVNNTSVSNGYQTWFASTNTNPLTSYNDRASMLEAWVAPKYDGRDANLNYVGTTTSYTVFLYTRQSGSSTWNQVATTDVCQWLWDYQTGILMLNGTSTAYHAIDSNTQFAISGWRYIGRKGANAGTITSIGGINGVKTDQSGGAAITTTGNVELDLTYSPTWTGVSTFTKQVHFTSPGGASGAHLSLATTGGTAPSTISDGELWYDGSSLNFRYGSSTVDLLNTLTINTPVGGGGSLLGGLLYINYLGELKATYPEIIYNDSTGQLDVNCTVSMGTSGFYLFDNSLAPMTYPTPQNGIEWKTYSDSLKMFFYQHDEDGSDFWILGSDNETGDRFLVGLQDNNGIYANKETVSISHTDYNPPSAGIHLNTATYIQGNLTLSQPAVAYQYVSTSATAMTYTSIIRNNGANFNGANGSTLTFAVDLSSYTEYNDTLILINIDGTSSPNTFSWGVGLPSNATTGFTQTGVPITGTLQALGTTGVAITFNSTTGGVLGETFGFRVLAGGVLKGSNAAPHYLNGTTTLGSATVDTTATLAATNSSATIIPIKVNAIAGQTAELQTWQVNGVEAVGLSSLGNLVFTPLLDGFGLRLGNLATSALPSATSMNAGGLVWDTTALAAKVSNGSHWTELVAVDSTVGAGTAGYLPVFQSGSTLVDSIVQQTTSTSIYVNGTFEAPQKSFRVPHPTIPNTDLVHGCLEGPEHAIYARNTGPSGRLEGRGKVRVPLPDYWTDMVGAEYTAFIQPAGRYGCFVSEQDSTGFTVECVAGLFSRWKRFAFDYFVVGRRLDAPLTVVQPRLLDS